MISHPAVAEFGQTGVTKSAKKSALVVKKIRALTKFVPENGREEPGQEFLERILLLKKFRQRFITGYFCRVYFQLCPPFTHRDQGYGIKYIFQQMQFWQEKSIFHTNGVGERVGEQIQVHQ